MTKQSPTFNTSVDAGTLVNITVSNGKVPVPSVVGKSQAQAKSDLANYGFNVNVVEQVDGSKDPGTVLAQSRQGGTTALKGTLVTITVATAPPFTPTPTPTPTPTQTQAPTPTPTPRSPRPPPRRRRRPAPSRAQPPPPRRAAVRRRPRPGCSRGATRVGRCS